MSGVRQFLSNLGPASSVFLAFAVIGGGTALVGGLDPGANDSNLLLGLFAFLVWVLIGLFFGGITWTVNTVRHWRRGLTTRMASERDPAVEVLRERYARGEIDQDQFESTLHRLKET